MSIHSSAHLEGRVNAHRRLLVELVSILGALPETRAHLLAMAGGNETGVDHQEDPGLFPDKSIAAQQIIDDEVRRIVRAAMARIEANVEHKSLTRFSAI